MYEKMKKILIMTILVLFMVGMFATFANFVIEHQRLLTRLNKDVTVVTSWRTMVSRNIKILCSDHEKRCEVLPDPDPDSPD